MNNYFKISEKLLKFIKDSAQLDPYAFDLISLNIWVSLNFTMKMITEHAFLCHSCRHLCNIKCRALYAWKILFKITDLKKWEKIIARIALKTQLLYVFDTQSNHSSYSFFLHIQLDGHQHLSREHTVHRRCPCHFAVTLGDHAGHIATGARLNVLECPGQSLLCPGDGSCNLRLLGDEGKMAGLSQ